jgi:glutamate formiminotransferase/glutamate formiminotransferase/formiminotetrahydrofolate cyclodeaminase
MLAIPNFSEGQDPRRIAALAHALTSVEGVQLLDIHSDPDHNRTVYTLAAADRPGGTPRLADSLTAGAAAAIEQLDIAAHVGSHPHVGTLDVAPIVYMDEPERGAACAEALVLGERLGSELGIPVFLYGVLTAGRVTRADVRRGGPRALQARIDSGEMAPDFGPRSLHPRAGAVLVSARPPLIAFNVELAPPATLASAQRIAALIREGGPEGLPAVKAIGLTLPHRDDVAQVSTNVEDYRRTNLATLVAAIARHATPVRAELVGVPPRAAFDGFPEDLPVANRRYLEDALRSASQNLQSAPENLQSAPENASDTH